MEGRSTGDLWITLGAPLLTFSRKFETLTTVLGEQSVLRKQTRKKTMTTIDLTPQEDDHQVLVIYKELMNLINQIDEKLDAGSENARRKEFVDNLVSSHQSDWEPVTTALIPQMESMSSEQLAANYHGIIRALNAAYKNSVDNFVKESFEALPQEEVAQASEAEKKALSEERSKLYAQVKAVIPMAETFNVNLGDDPMPKRRGAAGKRGPRALSLYSWTIDGAALDEDDNDPKGVAAALGFEKASQLTEYLKTVEVNGKKINTTNPPEEFTFTYNGKEVYAKREAEDEAPEVEEDNSGTVDSE